MAIPDYTGAFDPKKYDAFSNAWKTGFDANGGGSNISDTFSKLFDKTRQSDKWQSRMTGFGDKSERNWPYGSSAHGGEWSKTGAGQVLENLGVVYPQQHSPMFIPGQEGKKSGIFGQAGGLAGALGSAFGIFGPLGAPIGAAVGGLIDTATG